jgi:trigger factor
MLLIVMIGCNGNKDGNTSGAETADANETTEGAAATENSDAAEEADASDAISFSYSENIDENGLWEGIAALDYVELHDYDTFSIPSDIHSISDADVQTEVDAILSGNSTSKQITDRPVADGDTVNIDYVGSVDGVEFDGGSTGGAGTEVTIGVTSYIDDFLEQLIGHKPSETFDVNVTFPEDYGVENLNGKDAVFVTTINYISETVIPELNDAFVSDILSADYGWKTVAEMKNGIYGDLQDDAIRDYIQQYLVSDVVVTSIPEKILEYQESSMVKWYQDYADNYGIGLEEFLASYVGVSSMEELKELNSENTSNSAKLSLVIQAIAENSNIAVSLEDLSEYFKTESGDEDYSQFEVNYGLPYLKQIVLTSKVMNYLVDHSANA